MLKRLNQEYPIFQAPMAGVTTPQFVAACSEAGIVGAIGAGYLTGEDTRKFIREVKQLTNNPFMVNLFVPEAVEWREETIEKANASLSSIRQSLNLPAPDIQVAEHEFEQQIQVVIEEEVAICSFTFGLPSEDVVRRLKEHGVFLIGTATTVEEACLAEERGMDAVVAQGKEAGGHRGSFSGDVTYVPLVQLVSEIREAVNLPIIAAGGIANKQMMDELLVIGAEAAQIGTALLVAEESGAHPLHKKEILQSSAGGTVLTKGFSGKYARGLNNEFIKHMEGAFIAPYPIQNTCTQDIRKASAEQGKSQYMSLWAGEQAHLSESGTVKEIVKRFL